MSQDLLFSAIPRTQQPRPLSKQKMNVHQLEKRPVVLRDEKERNAYEQEEEITYVNALRERMKEEQDFKEEKRKREAVAQPIAKTKVADAVEQSLEESAKVDSSEAGPGNDEPPSGRHLDLFV